MKLFIKMSIILAISSVTLIGCKKNSLAGFQPEIINAQDNFQLQATGVKKVSDNLEYSWSNTGTLAKVDHSSSIKKGTATLIILDADGQEVYNKDLSTDGSYTSSAGSAGLWTIKVKLKKLDGDLNFRVQKGN